MGNNIINTQPQGLKAFIGNVQVRLRAARFIFQIPDAPSLFVVVIYPYKLSGMHITFNQLCNQRCAVTTSIGLRTILTTIKSHASKALIKPLSLCSTTLAPRTLPSAMYTYAIAQAGLNTALGTLSARTFPYTSAQTSEICEGILPCSGNLVLTW